MAPRVPEYQRSVALRPDYQYGMDVQATPDQMGAAVGRGMQQLGRGMDAMSDALSQVQDLEDTALAKERDNALAEWDRNAKYGEGGFMTLQGKAAVDARADYEKRLQEKQRELSSDLRPGAAQKFKSASDARLQSSFQSSIIHTANERKTWFKEASSARIQTFADDALAVFNNPEGVKRNLAAGIMELRQQGQLEGWDADTLALKEKEYSSGVHKNIALRIAQDDPLRADKYVKANAGTMTAAHQYELNATLENAVKEEQSRIEADAILTEGRKVSELPGDIVGEVAGVSGGVESPGPTRARSFLLSRLSSGHNKEHITGLQESFATNLSAMIQDAPPHIREKLGVGSGYRSVERQQELWNQALKKYGSPAAARKWVAPPGNSKHNHGQAVDLTYNGQFLGKAPKEVQDWVHQNARKYGLYFPMSHEPWHIEPVGSRGGTVAPRTNVVAARSTLPSYDDIEGRLSAISDPKVRELTRKRLYSAIETQNKMAEANEKAAKVELWRYIDQGMTPDQVPVEVRQAAGMSAVSSAWGYLETAAKGREIESDDILLYEMRRYAATNPTDFADIDLNDYRDRLSKEAITELTGFQTSALSDQRKAKEDGITLTTAFSQADSQLAAVGLSAAGKDGSAREEVSRRIALFQNSLASEMEAFKRASDGRNPNQVEIQSMINRLLLPVVITQKGAGFFGGDTETNSMLFEAGGRIGDIAPGVSVGVEYDYDNIPAPDKMRIEAELTTLNGGRKPSEQEVERVYNSYLQSLYFRDSQ